MRGWRNAIEGHESLPLPPASCLGPRITHGSDGSPGYALYFSLIMALGHSIGGQVFFKQRVFELRDTHTHTHTHTHRGIWEVFLLL